MSETEQVEVPECVTLWICCHCKTPRTVGLSVCERCHKRLYDKVEYFRASEVAPQGDALHDPACCAKYMRGEPVPQGAHECGDVPWCRRCAICVADATTPVTAPVSTGDSAERVRHHEMTPERWEELQAALDRPEGPTEAEAEEVLQHCGTSGRDVVNQLIEHLLNENQRLSTALFDLGIELEKDGSVSVEQKKFHAAICEHAAASTTPDGERDALVDEVELRMGYVVEAAVEWHQAGREGGEWFEAADKLGAAIESLLELRATPATTPPPAVTEAGEQLWTTEPPKIDGVYWWRLSENDQGKDPAAVALGKRGGSKGGRKRAENLSPKRRQQIARRAARRFLVERRSQ